MIRLAAFADEADKTLEGQIDALKRNGIEYIEVRGIYDKNVSKLTCEEAEVYAARLANANIKVWSIGSPIGKIKISEFDDEYKEKLRHLCRLAKIFGTNKIRMFSFYEAYEREAEVFAALSEMRDIAAEEGVGLYHENEKAIYGDSLERVLRIMDNVKGLNFVYDPANFIEVGEDPALTLEPLFGRTDYFHIKDAISETHQIVPAGYGDGRIGDLVKLIGDEDRVLTIEPHLSIFRGYSEIDSFELKNKYQYKNNNEAFDAAVAAIKSVIIAQGYKEVEGGFVKL